MSQRDLEGDEGQYSRTDYIQTDKATLLFPTDVRHSVQIDTLVIFQFVDQVVDVAHAQAFGPALGQRVQTYLFKHELDVVVQILLLKLCICVHLRATFMCVLCVACV